MQKLNKKNQTPRQQRQAAQSVMVYRDIRNQFKHGKPDNLENHHGDSPWETIYQKLNDEVRIRNYSDKTYQTYAGWIGRFEQFINRKSPDKTAMFARL